MTDPGWYVDPLDRSQYRYWDGAAWTEAVSPGSAAAEAGSPGSAAAQETELPQTSADQVTTSIPAQEPHGYESVPNEGFGIPPEVAVERHPTVPPPNYRSTQAGTQEFQSGTEAPPHTQPGVPGSGPGDPSWIPRNQAMPRSVSAPEATRSRSKAPWLILGALTLLVAVVVAVAVVGFQGETSVDAIAEGQCFADFDQFQETEIRSTVSTADCADEHALEVFEVTSAPYVDFSEYPGSEVIEDVAFTHCLAGFQEFVGIAYEESVLDVWALYPTNGSWDVNDDREVVCMVGAFDQSLTTGTLRGSGR